jgi:hypothetical protein
MRGLLAFLLLTALVTGLMGCGSQTKVLSVDEYDARMQAIQDGLSENLDTLSQRLGSITQLDYYDLMDLEDQVVGTAEAFKAAKGQAVAMNTPDEVQDIHKSFINFYSFGEDISNEIASDIAFFHNILPMLTDVENLALPNIVPEAEVARIKAAAAEDVSSMQGYEKGLKGMNPPSELEPYKETLANFFRSIENAVADVDRAITPEDRSMFLQFQQDFAGMLNQQKVYTGMISVYLVNFRDRIDYLSRQTQAMNAQL